MTHNEISTLAKAAYVIVTPAGQTPANMSFLGETFIDNIDNLSPILISVGEEMSMREMVLSLQEFSNHAKIKALTVLNKLVNRFDNPVAKRLGKEIIDIVKSGKYTDYEMPELAIRIAVDTELHG